MIIAEYIWHDSKSKLRSKTRVIHEYIKNVTCHSLPLWNYDGSSTNQATTDNSEVIIKPVYICKDPFRNIDKNLCLLVLCDTWLENNKPHPNNTRAAANKIFDRHVEHQLMFGLEQEFFLTGDSALFFDKKVPHYCMQNIDSGRACIEEAFKNCIVAGLKLTGLNSEVAPYQWEYQICQNGILAADELCIMRFIVDKVAHKYGYFMNLDPKPYSDHNGSGCHINFSTDSMRKQNNKNLIQQYINKLEKNHKTHIENYGYNNNLRLTGLNETSSINNFTYGKGDRTASIRIPSHTYTYIEDRRPASNIDPYIATSLITQSICD